MDSAKHNIRKIVKTYVQAFPEEFAAFQEQMKGVRALTNEKALVDGIGTGSSRNVQRLLYEMPVTLHEMLVKNLSEDQLSWLKQSGHYGVEGGHWFANTFPAFRVPEKV